MCTPLESKSFQFHAVFGKIWQNHMLAPPMEGWRPHLGETLDPPLEVVLDQIPLEVIFLFPEFFRYDLEEPLLIFPI